jgi:hypothetical protein
MTAKSTGNHHRNRAKMILKIQAEKFSAMHGPKAGNI